MQPENDMWPHQRFATKEITSFFKAGGKRLCCVCPTGGGKSRIGQAWNPDVVFVHTNTLLAETRLKFPRAHCLTVQSCMRAAGKRVLVDECHHYKADVWGSIFTGYPDADFLGLTATPERGDGKPLDMFQGMIVASQYSGLIRAGFIVPCQVIYPGEPVEGLAMDPVDAFFEHGDGRRGFIFCSSLEQARDVAHRLRERSSKAEAIGSDQPAEARQALSAFKAGFVDLICSVEMVSEGIDVPSASLAILARSVGTVGGYLQKVGRVLRASPGKRNARLIDLSGAVFAHGLPTQDRIYSLNGDAIQRVDTQGVQNCPKCGACYLPRPTCPRCGFAAPVKHREVKITRADMQRAAGNFDETKVLENLLKLRSVKGHQWYWVVTNFEKLCGKKPDLRQVSESEKNDELNRLKKEGTERGYKQGYAYARWNEIFG